MSQFLRCSAALLLVILHPWSQAARADDKPQFRSFDSMGTKIAYFVQGQGEPVILIHGWLSSAGINWTLPGISEKLAKKYQVIALDVRGHGLSDKPTREEDYGPELVEDIARLMDHLKIEKAHVVGYSMGGIITANFIARHPDRVRSGVLGGMGWLKEGEVAQWAFSQIGKRDANAKPVAICGRSLAKLALSEEQIKSIKAPVTVLIGENDRLIRRLYLEKLQQARPDWPVVSISNGDHVSCIKQPQFVDEILKWLDKNS